MIISFDTGKVETTGGGGSGLLQQKKVTITENGLDVVVPDAGYDGLSTVYVKTYVANDSGMKDFSVLGYDEELNIQLNEVIDADIAYSKSLYDKNKTLTGTQSNFLSSDRKLVYAPAFNTSGVIKASYFLSYTDNLKVIPHYDWSSCTELYSFLYQSGIEEVDFSSWDVSNVEKIYHFFSFCSKLKTVDVSNWYFPKCITLTSMFDRCSKLTEIKGIEDWDVSNITQLDNMFNGCSSLTSLDLSGWDVSNVTDMSNMFQNCSGLTLLNVSNWNTSGLTNTSYNVMTKAGANSTESKLIANNCIITHPNFFGESYFNEIDMSGSTLVMNSFDYLFYNCERLDKITGFYFPPEVKKCSNLFYNNRQLKEIDFNGTTTENIDNMRNMFQNCTSITKIPSISLKSITDNNPFQGGVLGSILYNCTKLIEFGGFVDTDNITNWSYSSSYSPFYYLTSLETIHQMGTIKGDYFDVNRCTKLTVDSLMVIINALYDYVGNGGTATYRLTLGSTNLAKLTDEQKAIATSKGWTLS